MKKSVSFMLALMAVASMSMNAFAADLDAAPAEDISVFEAAIDDANHTEADAAAATSGIAFGTDAESQKGFDHLLTPGEVYEFPIYLVDEHGEKTPLKDKDLEDNKIRVEGSEGRSAVSSIKIVDGKDGYVLEVVTEEGYPTKQTAFKGVVKLVKKANGQVVHSADVKFTVGYASISNDAINGVKADEYVYIDENAPVITKEQFSKIDRNAEGKKVTFTNGEWAFQVRVADQDSVNLIHNERAIKDVVAAFEDLNFKFLSFPAKPEFDFTGKLTIDVSDEMEDFGGKFYVYRYTNGKLHAIDATLDKEDETLSFSTKTLGRFVISDRQIPDGAAIAAPDEEVSKPAASTNKPNPSTGAGAMGSVAAAASALSAAALGLLSRKKR